MFVRTCLVHIVYGRSSGHDFPKKIPSFQENLRKPSKAFWNVGCTNAAFHFFSKIFRVVRNGPYKAKGSEILEASFQAQNRRSAANGLCSLGFDLYGGLVECLASRVVRPLNLDG